MTRPLIHIGYHKTGTSYLQQHCFLSEGRGFGSPWIRGECVHHFVLTHPARYDPARVRACFERDASAIQAKGCVPVVSQENLSGFPMRGRYYGFEVARRLHAALPHARIVIGVREQKAMLRSMYAQYVKQDGEWPLEQFLGTGSEELGFAPICRLDHLEYDLLVAEYQRLFGADSVLVLPYELLKQDPPRFEQCLHDFCETGITASQAQRPVNPSEGALTLACRRRLNRAIKRPPLAGRDYHALPPLWRLKQRICRAVERTVPTHWQRRVDQRIVDWIEARVDGHYAKSNARLGALTQLDLEGFGYET